MNAPNDVISTWVLRARSDVQLARAALRTRGVLLEDACFHAQQCAEKALKALLLRRGITFHEFTNHVTYSRTLAPHCVRCSAGVRGPIRGGFLYFTGHPPLVI